MLIASILPHPKVIPTVTGLRNRVKIQMAVKYRQSLAMLMCIMIISKYLILEFENTFLKHKYEKTEIARNFNASSAIINNRYFITSTLLYCSTGADINRQTS